jgi:hypothetical protein
MVSLIFWGHYFTLERIEERKIHRPAKNFPFGTILHMSFIEQKKYFLSL